MTAPLHSEDNPRRADRPVAFSTLRTMPQQPAPFLVTAARPLPVVACEALPVAASLLARGNVRQPVGESGVVAHGFTPVA